MNVTPGGQVLNFLWRDAFSVQLGVDRLGLGGQGLKLGELMYHRLIDKLLILRHPKRPASHAAHIVRPVAQAFQRPSTVAALHLQGSDFSAPCFFVPARPGRARGLEHPFVEVRQVNLQCVLSSSFFK